jgi:hypothetical protein
MEKVFKLYSDTKQNWLAVKRNLLEELQLTNKVSAESRMKGKTVYLNTTDTELFTVAYTTKYGQMNTKNVVHTEKSWVKTLAQYSPTVVNTELPTDDNLSAVIDGVNAPNQETDLQE